MEKQEAFNNYIRQNNLAIYRGFFFYKYCVGEHNILRVKKVETHCSNDFVSGFLW